MSTFLMIGPFSIIPVGNTSFDDTISYAFSKFLPVLMKSLDDTENIK